MVKFIADQLDVDMKMTSKFNVRRLLVIFFAKINCKSYVIFVIRSIKNRLIFFFFRIDSIIWVKVFKNGPSKILRKTAFKKFEVIWSP